MPTASGHTRAIAASKVQGTSVYNTAGEAIGHVEDIVLDKLTDKVLFAVLGFGGFLGIGEKYHAMPWSMLDYVPAQGGYVVKLSRQQLEGAPTYELDDLIRNDGSSNTPSFDYYSRLTPH
ncbi:PRC-barrel domain-containing protein [Roseiarcaceae bacterium H3SJ34-1]|uniref:PRC-barrel domain-containing protein n=1 Tax=Terripilifer ovatus TaxID=3032367 RepID=UPI003AB945B6|nr:PRC-barrel domain-containing protein [Roseiarcaceae bacterium H3SJ34-1]